MRHKIIMTFTMIVSCIFSKTSSSAPVPIPFQENIYSVEPLSFEAISPIELPKCPWIKVVEWRYIDPNNNVSDKYKNLLGETCHMAVMGFPGFLRAQKMNKQINLNDFDQKLSLIPIDDNFRNLNDLTFRFSTREKTYWNGQVVEIWGYTDYKSSMMFVRSDLFDEQGSINKEILVVFAHEIYHALSYRFKIREIYQNDRRVEEDMAHKFTRHLQGAI